MSGGGSSTTTSSSTVPQTFLNAYNSTVNRASSVASTPYQAYNGQLVAGFTPDQTQAQSEVEGAQGSYQPALNAEWNAVGASTSPLWSNTMQTGVNPSSGIAGYTPNFYSNGPQVNASTIAQYETPYQSQVIGATEAQINNTDAQQQAQLTGNAASQGALGGDRQGVAQGILGGQQAIANNSTLAGLNQSNYSQALGEANQQQQTGIAANEASLASGESEFNNQQQAQLSANEANAWLNSQAGYAYGNLAQEGNNLALGDASALAQSGLTEQQQQQAGLNTAYEQWQAQQAFPYQQTGWLANITEGIGSNVGGSSTTTQTNNAAGGRVPRAAGGIVPRHYDSGGGILSDIPDVATSWIPSVSGGGGGGRGPPSPMPAQVPQNQMSPTSMIGAAGGATSLYNNLGGPQLIGSNGIISGPLFGGSSAPSIIGNAGMGIASDGESVPLTNMGSSAFAPGLDTLSTPSAATVGAYNPSLFGSMFGSGAAASVPSAEIASSAIPTGLGAGALDSTIPTLTADAAGGAGAGGAGFLGSLGSAVDAGASAAGDALASGASAIGAGVGALGDAAASAASAVGAGLSDLATWLLPLFALKDGGAVPSQPRAHGGIVVPFPAQRRAFGGGIGGHVGASPNAGMMPYNMAPPVAATSTTGGPPQIGYIPTAGASGAPYAFGGGIGSGRGIGTPTTGFGSFVAPAYTVSGTPGAGNTNPLGMLSPSQGGSAASMGAFPFGMRRGGGIVVPFRRHFDDGGATDPQPTDAMVNQLRSDEAAGAQADAATASGAAASPAPQSNTSISVTPSTGPAQTYQPEKPNLWLPALAGIATAALGRHHEAGHNIAEGVLAGLGTYSKEDEQYQGQQEKAATIQQEAKRLADQAEQHRQEIAEESRHNVATEGTAAQQAAALASHYGASDQADMMNARTNAARAASEAQQAAALASHYGASDQADMMNARTNAARAASEANLQSVQAEQDRLQLENEKRYQALINAPQQNGTSGGIAPPTGGASAQPGQPKPVMDLPAMAQRAQLLINSGNPGYVAAGKALLDQVHEAMTSGVTLASDGSVMAVPGSADVAANRAGAIATAESKPKILESLSNRAAEPLQIAPNSAATTGFNLLPPELQRQIINQAGGPQSSGSANPPLAGNISQTPQAQPQQPSASFRPSAPPAQGIPSVTRPPPDLPPTQSLASPSLVRNPDGSLTNSVNSFSRASADAQGKDVGAIPQHLETLGNTRTQLVAINNEIQQNAQSPGFVQQGWGAGTRTTIAKAANSASAALGGGPVFDPASIGNNESFIKNSNVAAFTLARTMSGGRVALGEVLQANQSVPNINNSFYGNSVVSNLLLQDNMRQTDRLRYQAQQADRGVSPTVAGDMFDRINPPDRYVVAAMATAAQNYNPRGVQKLTQAPTAANIAAFDRRYGQGTSETILRGAQ